MNRSIGAHRLGIFIGCVATIAWLGVVLLHADDFLQFGIEEIIFTIIGMVLGFFAGYLFIKGIFWVIEGFRKDRYDS